MSRIRPAAWPQFAATAHGSLVTFGLVKPPPHPFRNRALAIGLGMLCMGASTAQTAPMPAPADLERAFALLRQAAAARGPAGARIEVLPGTADLRLKLADCARAEPHLPPGASAWGRTRVGLRCVDGAVAWTVYWPATVQVWANAAVPRAPLPAGTVLTAADLMLAPVDWAAAATPPTALIKDASGRTLARHVAPGQALLAADLRARQWFAGGDVVQLVATGAGFAISSEAKALAAGIEGQPVRVITEQGRTLVGKPVGERRVEVAL